MESLKTILQGKESSHILPFLWMKGESNDIIKEELDRIEECGIREICLESRPHPDFCGPGWWENLDFVIPEAKKRGMKVWILDDDKFPTGHANGGFERQPDKKKWYLAERHMDICGPCKNNAVLVENFLYPDGKLLGILAVPKPDGDTLAISSEGMINLTENYENGFVFFSLPEGRYRLFILFTTQNGGGREDYMNLIDCDSVRVLIDEVYEKHYERYGEYFGNTISGFFSDEPELGNVKGYPFDNTLGRKDQRLPWSKELEQMLREMWKEEFIFNLPTLWYESGEKTTGVRTDYMETMTNLVKTCFSGQLGAWCEAHQVEYIGHIIEDDNAHTRMACSIGHYFREMEGQHMAGIDVVHHQIVPGFTEPVHQWIAGDRDGEFFHYGLAKLGASAAHIQPNKKNRALCEIFGNYGWAEGISFMKWLTDHMLVRGINQFTPHAFSMSYPDRDCPPHFYARGNNPGFEGFTYLMKYMNRSAAFLSDGVHIADAAVLYHAEAEWAGGAYMCFQKPGRALMEQQLDYDVIPADILKSGNVKFEQGQLVVGEERYFCLILPYAQYLERQAAEFVKMAYENGVKVYQIDKLPDGDTHKKPLSEDFGKFAEVVSLEEIAGKVKEQSQPFKALDVESDCRNLRSFFMKDEESIRAMFFNEDVSHKASAVIEIKDEAFTSVEMYDPWINQSECYAVSDAKVKAELLPGQVLFMQFEKVNDGVLEKANLAETMKPAFDWKISCRENRTEEYKEYLHIAAGKELPNLNGPGYQIGFTGTYRYESSFATKKEEKNRYRLTLPEVSDYAKVFVNDKLCGVAVGFPASVDITEALADGENNLTIDVVTTLVWERKDGASTHLQIPASGMIQNPEIEVYR